MDEYTPQQVAEFLAQGDIQLIDVRQPEEREAGRIAGDRFIELYMEVLDEAGLPADAAFRQAVLEHVTFGSHVAQQNSRAETDADLHPIREVPHWDWPAS